MAINWVIVGLKLRNTVSCFSLSQQRHRVGTYMYLLCDGAGHRARVLILPGYFPPGERKALAKSKVHQWSRAWVTVSVSVGGYPHWSHNIADCHDSKHFLIWWFLANIFHILGHSRKHHGGNRKLTPLPPSDVLIHLLLSETMFSPLPLRTAEISSVGSMDLFWNNPFQKLFDKIKAKELLKRRE